ncbi:hypothetical protein EZBTHKR_0650 [Elizabethkingia anophelis]|nr:hypothetical protein EZBTHKR_0650 [Elizabethkingia anophelis]
MLQIRQVGFFATTISDPHKPTDSMSYFPANILFLFILNNINNIKRHHILKNNA